MRTSFDHKGVPNTRLLRNDDDFEAGIERLFEKKMEQWALRSTTLRSKLTGAFPELDFDFSTIGVELLESFDEGTVSPGERSFWISALNRAHKQKLGVEVKLTHPMNGHSKDEPFVATITSPPELVDLF